MCDPDAMIEKGFYKHHKNFYGATKYQQARALRVTTQT